MADAPPIDIEPKDWAIVRDILARIVPTHVVWAFGSRAARRAKPYSDLDLAVVGGTPLDLGLMAELASAFQESALPFKVDVVDYAATAESFRKIIEAQKVIVWCPPQGSKGVFRPEPES